MPIKIVPNMKYYDAETTDEEIPKRKKEAKKLSKRIKRKAEIRKADAKTSDEGGGGGGTKSGGRKRSRGSMKKGLSEASKTISDADLRRVGNLLGDESGETTSDADRLLLQEKYLKRNDGGMASKTRRF